MKIHKSTLTTKEREILAREAAVAEKEAQIASVFSQKDAEIIALKDMVNQLQQHHQVQVNVEVRIREAVAKREDELRIAVAKREEEVAAAMVRREEEIMGAIRKREAEISEAWKTREEQIKKEVAEEVDERVKWVIQRTEELSDEEERLESIRLELEERAKVLEALKGKPNDITRCLHFHSGYSQEGEVSTRRDQEPRFESYRRQATRARAGRPPNAYCSYFETSARLCTFRYERCCTYHDWRGTGDTISG